MTAFEYC